MKYCQDYDNEKLKNYNEEKQWRPKKKETKDHFETCIRGVYCQNCYNEGHLTKLCKLLNKLYHICKQNNHNIDQCPNKAVTRRCPSKEIVLMHVVQVKTPTIQK